MEEKCILCLKLNKNVVNYLAVCETDSGKYPIVSLIEKHLWPVNLLKSQSQWLCSACWQALLEFHQFYRRIEDAQTYFNHEINSEHIKTQGYKLYEFENEILETSVVPKEINDEESIIIETSIISNEITDEVSGGPIDNSEYELYSTLLQNEEEKENGKCLDNSADREVHHDASSAEFMSNLAADLFKCHICEKLFRNQEVLEKHIAWHQGTGCSNLVTDLFQCHICEKLFRNQEVLEKHIAWHVGTVCSCEICDLKFFDLSTLIQHKRVHVPNEKILKLAHQGETNVNVSCGDFEYMETEEEQDTSITPSDSNVFPLACTYCSKVFASQETMENHIAWHKGNIQKCNICDLQFINIEKYNIHNLVHKNKYEHIALEYGFKCKYCINIYDDKQAYLNHLSSHENNIFYCTICDLQFLNAFKFYQHKSTHDLNNTQTLDINSGGEHSQHEKPQKDVNNPYQEETPCIASEKEKFKRGKKILKLVENTQEENENNIPELLEETVESLYEEINNDTIDTHEIEVSSIDSLQLIEVECTICYKVLENGNILSYHMAWHEGNVFHCTICELKFFDKTIYENHYASHANEVEDSDDNIGSEYFICSICSKVSKSRRHFLNHNAWHVGTIYTCDICDLQFLDKTKYEDHQETHLPKDWKRCRECGKAFECARFVKRHWEKMHRNKFIQICDICGMVYRCPLSFKRHTDKHRGQIENTTIPCDICGRLIKGKAGLKSHKRINHPENGIHPYVCDICLKPIATRALLNSHIALRHGPKDSRHTCLVCDKTFRSYTLLKKHSDAHNTEAKYSCQWCSEKFYRKNSLQRHRQKDHPKEYAEWKSKLYVKI